jgi:hypothetical protein
LHTFCAFSSSGYKDHNNFDYDYIMTDYVDLNIDIKNKVNHNSRTPVNSVCVITCVYTTPAMNEGVKREEAPKGEKVTALGARPVDGV